MTKHEEQETTIVYKRAESFARIRSSVPVDMRTIETDERFTITRRGADWLEATIATGALQAVTLRRRNR